MDGKTLMEMMPSDADRRTEAIVKRALNQIGNALKDHGLYVTVDTDGNYGIGRMPEAEDLRAALRTAITHIDHMAAWITAQKAGYSFESLGEDMPGIRAAAGETR